MKIRFQIAVLFIAGTSTLLAQPSTQFAKANQEYAAGDFKAAVEDYEQLVRSGERTANLFYDLGNAYFRSNDFGRAILNYERALALDPRHPEAAANLRIARDEARALELMPAKLELLFGFASANQFAVTAAIAFWVGLFSIVAFAFSQRRRNGAAALAIFSLLVFAVAVSGAYQLDHGKSGSGWAIVTGQNVEARLATADTAHTVLALPPGSEIKIASQRGDWVYALLPNNLRGWMPAKSAEEVRL
jgi:tetratricopeptide (TPR) repeat protein